MRSIHAALRGHVQADGTMTDRPNVLFFITDQLRADHLGCYGNRTIRTPAIDSLAARGVAFDRFYVASPVCQPNRATLVTGRMPSLHGVRYNGISLSLAANTFVDLFRAAGWRTALIGKSHLQNMTGMPTVVEKAEAARQAIAAARGLRRGREGGLAGDPAYEQENGRAWDQNPTRTFRLPYYGFDHVELCSGHASRCTAPIRAGCASAGPTPTRCAARRTPLPSQLRAAAGLAHQPAGGALPDLLRGRAHPRLSRRPRAHEASAPFFLQCSFPDPHHPFTPPGRYWDMYKPQDMELPASFRIGNRTLPPHAAALHRRARQRHPQGRRARRLRGERAGNARGDRAHLRHDRDDRRRHGENPQAARRARPRARTP